MKFHSIFLSLAFMFGCAESDGQWNTTAGQESSNPGDTNQPSTNIAVQTITLSGDVDVGIAGELIQNRGTMTVAGVPVTPNTDGHWIAEIHAMTSDHDIVVTLPTATIIHPLSIEVHP